MLPTLLFHVTRDRVRVELDGVTLAEEVAVVALHYRARSRGLIVAVGEEARQLASETPGLGPAPADAVLDSADRFIRVVPASEAPWWREGEHPDYDPWAHNGECVVLWPFDPETYSPAIAAALLRYVRLRAVRPGDERVGLWTRALFRVASRSVVRLAEPPPTEEMHRALVKEAGMRFGPPPPPARRPLAELTWQQWAALALAALGLPLFAYVTRLRRIPLEHWWWMMLLFIAMAVELTRVELAKVREGASHALSRESLAAAAATRAALRRFAAVPDRDPQAKSFVFGATRWTTGIPAVLLAFGFMQGALAIVIPRLAWLPRGLGTACLLAVMLAAAYLGYQLALLILGARIAIGERAIVLRRAGLFGHSLVLPFEEILSAVASEGRVSLLLQGGGRIDLQAGLPMLPSSKKTALAVEEAILSRLGPRPYR